MIHHSSKRRYPVRGENPDAECAMLLQQATRGVEGKIRVAMQDLFRAMHASRDLLISTATEERSHIDMLSYAVALNLEGGWSERVAAERSLARRPFLRWQRPVHRQRGAGNSWPGAGSGQRASRLWRAERADPRRQHPARFTG